MKARHILLAAAALIVAAIAGAFVLRDALVGRWIERNLAAKLSDALEAEVEFEGLVWKDGVLRAELGRMGGGRLPFETLRASGLRAEVDWKRLMKPLTEPLCVEAAGADVVWRAGNAPAVRPGDAGAAAPKEHPTMEFVVGKFSLRHPDKEGWAVRDTSLRAKMEAGQWSFAARGGTFSALGMPPAQLDKLAARQRGGGWAIESFALGDGEGGTVEGTALHEGGAWSGEFTWKNLDASKFLRGGASEHFSGRTSGNAKLKGGVLRGRITVTGAETKKVPALVKLASHLVRENWDSLPWETFSFDFVREADGAVAFSNLEAVSPKGLRVRGSGRIAAESLAADLDLGVRREGRPWLVAFVPVLFRAETDGYFWLKVRMGGTPSAPTEDLTTRVVAALALAPAAGAAGAAAEIPSAAVEAAGSLLNTLMGR